MKKKSESRKKDCIKSRCLARQTRVSEKNLNLAHPVVKASYVWSIVSDQLNDILGSHVHHQWFKNVRPLVISDQVLILEVPNHFSAQWIHTHYHELVDILLSAQNKKLSSFFISQTERLAASKSSAAVIKR